MGNKDVMSLDVDWTRDRMREKKRERKLRKSAIGFVKERERNGSARK